MLQISIKETIFFVIGKLNNTFIYNNSKFIFYFFDFVFLFFYYFCCFCAPTFCLKVRDSDFISRQFFITRFSFTFTFLFLFLLLRCDLRLVYHMQ